MNYQQIHIQIINQFFELGKKIAEKKDSDKLDRTLRRIKSSFEEIGLHYYNPIGEVYNETRTDCEASIGGKSTENLYITEVIKPIIIDRSEGKNTIVQKAIVIVEAK
jgi:hypothetical protein